MREIGLKLLILSILLYYPIKIRMLLNVTTEYTKWLMGLKLGNGVKRWMLKCTNCFSNIEIIGH